MINPSIFRQYDIRGVVGKDFTPEHSYHIAQAIIQYAQEKNIKLATLVVGRDARTHSEKICKHFIEGCKALGINIVDIGVVPTPALYFTINTTGYVHGVMITASHNPAEYNGFKICFNQKSLYGKDITRIGEIVAAQTHKSPALAQGGIKHYDALSKYINYLTFEFAHLENMERSIIFDCNSSPAAPVIHALIRKLNWKNCSTIHDIVDGTFPHQKPDPTVDKNGLILKELLAQIPATFGIGFDGDADRMSARTEDGELISGDSMLAILSKKVLQEYPSAHIVFDIKSSNALTQVILQNGGIPIMSPTGHSNIKVTMAAHNALLGGELSGHFFFADTSFGYDDGIYAALRLIDHLCSTQQTLTQAVSEIPKSICTPELRIPCPEQEKSAIIANVTSFFATASDAKIITIDGIRIEKKYGWGILRASNTEPLLSLRFEGENPEGLQHIKNDFLEILETCIDKADLNKHFSS
jgi:phosphomannomutase/phosphoglucomutase